MRSAREWAARHRWVTALIIIALILVALYAAFVLKFVWDMQHSSL
jgi:predicted RND superfamily exporter protein